MAERKYETHERLLAKLTWALLQSDGPFESAADLADALKFRCARLRIHWTPEEISAAFRLIESNTPLYLRRRGRLAADRPRLEPELSRADARAILGRLGLTVPTVPRVKAAVDIYARVEDRDEVDHDRY